MKQYRLLRNNRETGPHTAEELIHSGFKKYDLIWAEGKSAAWRYPGELDEFKQYAPIIEEQPYDRFYKKPAPVTSPKKEPAFLEINNIPAIATHKQKPRIKIKADCHKIETSQIKEPSLKKEFTTTFEPVQKAVPEWKDMWLNWEQEKQAVSNNTAKKNKINNTPALEIKYSQSLDDIKERYAETVLHSKNKSSFSRNNNYITAIILITAILGIGVWMGIKWSGSDGKNEPANAIHQQPVLSTAEPLKDGGINSEATFPVNKQSPENTGNDNQENIKSTVTAISQNTNTTTGESIKKTKTNADKTNYPPKLTVEKNKNSEKNYSVKKESVAITDKKPIVQNTIPVPAERNDVSAVFHRSAAKEPQIKDYISVESYTPSQTEAVGVKYTVQNISDIKVDLVMIDLQYYDAGGHYQKGETVYARNIAAGQTITVKAPDNLKAAKINYKVSMISSEAKSLYLIAD